MFDLLGNPLLALALVLPRVIGAFLMLPLMTQQTVPPMVRNSFMVSLGIMILPVALVGLPPMENLGTIDTTTGYDVTMSFFVYNKPVRGPMASIVRFEAQGTTAEDNTVLKLITHEGDHVVANAFSEVENAWVAAEGNRWLQQVRARNPNPLG